MNGPIDFTPYLSVAGLAGLLFAGLTLVKQVVALPPKIIPYVALGAGVVLELAFAGVTEHLTSANAALGYAVVGGLAGLTAIGVHESTIDKLLPSPPATPPGPRPAAPLVDGHATPPGQLDAHLRVRPFLP